MKAMILGLALVGAFAAAGASAQRPKGETFQIYSTPGRVMAMARIGDHPPIPVVFDTGTSGNILDRKLAALYGLPQNGPSTAIDGSLGKPVPGFFTQLSHVRLGGVPIADGPANAIDYDLADEVGIFGPGSFSGNLVRMDIAGGTVTVLAKSDQTVPTDTPIPYIGKGDDALPSVVLDFGDLQVPAELDTGNNAPILLPLSMAAKLSLVAPPVHVGTTTSAAGQQPVFRARLKGPLKIGPLVLDQPDILFIDGGQPNAGLPIARKLIVIFDPAEARNWIMLPPPAKGQ